MGNLTDRKFDFLNLRLPQSDGDLRFSDSATEKGAQMVLFENY